MKYSKKKFLFLGLAHSVDDGRLAYMLAKAVQETYPGVSCYYLGRDSIQLHPKRNEYMQVVPLPENLNLNMNMFQRKSYLNLAKYIKDHGFDLVQASDARELPYAWVIKKISGVPVVYDSHEDYFNQQFEYGGKSPKALIKALRLRALEIACIRSMDAIFCTDEYLLNLYRQPVFSACSVNMVRNIPDPSWIREKPIVHNRKDLRLFYAGGINESRGIPTAADFAARFNSEGHGFTVQIHVFGRSNDLAAGLVSAGRINFSGHIDHADVFREIAQYDIGLCILKRIRKYERNIPIKNFEYMASGLPVLTSNFGPMLQYVSEAGAGITVDPDSYEEFRDALLRFSDRSFRLKCGENGIRYMRTRLSRKKELQPYLDVTGELLKII